MKLPTEIFGNVIVVHTPEQLASDTAEDFEAYVPTLQRNQIVLDMDNTEILDSAGLEAVLNIRDRMIERGGQLKISAANATNRKIFEITRLNQQIEIFQSVIESVKSFDV